jgi:hypothetical protein
MCKMHLVYGMQYMICSNRLVDLHTFQDSWAKKFFHYKLFL